jgi:DHA1 family inner membrane transport protein
MPLQGWILTLSAFSIGTAEFVIAGILTQVSDSMGITEGQAGYLISAYALAIVFGGPILTIYLAKFNTKPVLLFFMLLFIAGNLISAFAPNYTVLMVSRVITGLVQGPFYGIGSVVATSLVAEKMAGRAVGQMFAGLTLANVLGVPGGTWIGLQFGWHTTFITVSALGIVAFLAISMFIKSDHAHSQSDVKDQLMAFKNPMLLISLSITVLAWSGFMTRSCIAGTLAKEAMPNTKLAITNSHWLSETSPTAMSERTIATDHQSDAFAKSLSDERPPRWFPTIRPKPTTTRIQVTACEE